MTEDEELIVRVEKRVRLRAAEVPSVSTVRLSLDDVARLIALARAETHRAPVSKVPTKDIHEHIPDLERAKTLSVEPYDSQPAEWRDEIAAAWIDGATAVHNAWIDGNGQQDADFTEAGHDYAAGLSAPPSPLSPSDDTRIAAAYYAATGRDWSHAPEQVRYRWRTAVASAFYGPLSPSPWLKQAIQAGTDFVERNPEWAFWPTYRTVARAALLAASPPPAVQPDEWRPDEGELAEAIQRTSESVWPFDAMKPAEANLMARGIIMRLPDVRADFAAQRALPSPPKTQGGGE